MIASKKSLAALLPRLHQAPWLAVDTEADSLHSYPEKVCLIQVSIVADDVLVDPLAGLDLTPFWAVLRPRELILHGADYDLRMLSRCFGFVPSAVFDTMLAARLLGEREFGLRNLAAAYLGVQLEKGPQKADWSRRPLTERMTAYARNDTHYLQPLADLLRQRLIQQGRLEWHQEMCAELIHETTRPAAGDPKEAWRLKGSVRLSPRSLVVLREVWRWREREAIATNTPPFFVLTHDRLLALADAGGAGKAIGPLLPARYSARRRRGITEAVKRAQASPDLSLLPSRRNPGQRLKPRERKRLEQLRRRRDEQAVRLGLDPTLIASRATLNLLAVDWDGHASNLLAWQRELLAG